jgi:phosphoribosylformylglycinamidine synthase
MLIAGNSGGRFDLTPLVAANGGRLDRALFGEAGSRVLVAVSAASEDSVRSSARDADLPLVRLGTVGGDTLDLGLGERLQLAHLRYSWRSGLSQVW